MYKHLILIRFSCYQGCMKSWPARPRQKSLWNSNGRTGGGERAVGNNADPTHWAGKSSTIWRRGWGRHRAGHACGVVFTLHHSCEVGRAQITKPCSVRAGKDLRNHLIQQLIDYIHCCRWGRDERSTQGNTTRAERGRTWVLALALRVQCFFWGLQENWIIPIRRLMPASCQSVWWAVGHNGEWDAAPVFEEFRALSGRRGAEHSQRAATWRQQMLTKSVGCKWEGLARIAVLLLARPVTVGMLPSIFESQVIPL